MAKDEKPFTEEELEICRKYHLYSEVAKTHWVSKQYPKAIAEGDRRVNSPLSKKVLKSLQAQVNFFSSKPTA